MKYKTACVAVLGAWLLASPASAQRSRTAEIRAVDSYTRSLDAFAKNSSPQLIAADVSEYGSDKAGWQKFATAKTLEKFREKHEVYNLANSWIKNGRLVVSVITLSSPSGDWAKYLKLYFRNDGTLARSNSELRTFHGDFIARQTFYFDAKGGLLKKQLNFFDLSSGKPKKPDPSYIGDNGTFLDEDNYYQTTAQLPFANLIKNQLRGR